MGCVTADQQFNLTEEEEEENNNAVVITYIFQ